MRILYLLECINGSDWGSKGSLALMTSDSEEFVKQHIPGGWKYRSLCETKDDYYLMHLIPPSQQIIEEL